VFDAAMLVALWQFNKEELLAGLLLFRLLYYITPFALALAVLGGREILKGVVASKVPPLGPIATDALVHDNTSRRRGTSSRARNNRSTRRNGNKR
jgi:hypothetical protein